MSIFKMLTIFIVDTLCKYSNAFFDLQNGTLTAWSKCLFWYECKRRSLNLSSLPKKSKLTKFRMKNENYHKNTHRNMNNTGTWHQRCKSAHFRTYTLCSHTLTHTITDRHRHTLTDWQTNRDRQTHTYIEKLDIDTHIHTNTEIESWT